MQSHTHKYFANAQKTWICIYIISSYKDTLLKCLHSCSFCITSLSLLPLIITAAKDMSKQ